MKVLRRKNEQSIYQVVKIPKISKEVCTHIATEHLSTIKKSIKLVSVHL
jgi:hypothetical protein